MDIETIALENIRRATSGVTRQPVANAAVIEAFRICRAEWIELVGDYAVSRPDGRTCFGGF